ncbi:MAG TPA: DMT family transporter [Candidatus Limnocylindrales bacterium]|jgi:drug/metabolite transporter (DMT)-like permease
MDRRRIVGIGLGALAGAAYGTGPLFFKGYVYPAGVDWIAMLVWRFAFATLVSWIWLLVQPRARASLRGLDRRTVARLLFTGAFFVVNASVYYAAIEQIDISLVALLMSAYPAIVAVLSLRLGYRFQGKLAWGSLAIVVSGTVLTIGGVNAGTNQTGIILALLSPVAYAVYIVLTAWMAGERPGQTADMRSRGKGAEVPPAVAGAIMMTGTWMATLAVGLLAREPLLPTQIPSAAWPGLVGIGVFAAAIAIQAFYASAARIGAAQASLMATVEPIVVIFLGITFLNETFAPIQAVGAGVVLAGVLLAQFATPSESRPVVLEEP